MNSSLVIEASDKSGRWYLLPGSANSYELKLANESDHAVLCKLSLDEPADAGAVTPSSVTLKAGEARVVTVAFKPEWLSLRDRKAVVSARDAAGAVLATFVHDLVAATTTDCSVSLAWKEPIEGEGALRGFVLLCTVRSISSTPGIFEPEFVPHPSIRFPEKQRITLGPGETTSFDVPVIWNRSARDNEGWNHPRTIEVGIAVTHGRRSATAPWDLVQQHIEPYLADSDRAPVIARRPPPPQFTQPGGGAPPMSPLVAAPVAEPTMGPVVTDTHAARIARSEMEAGVAGPGLRLPPQPTAPPAPIAVERETIAVAPGTLLLIGLAIGAIAIVLVWILRVPPSSSAVSTAPVPVLSQVLAAPKPSAPRSGGHGAKAHPPRVGASPVATTAPATVANNPTATSAPPGRAAVAATQPSSGQRQAPHSTTPPANRPRQATTPQRVSAVDRSALVQLGNVGAEFLRGGRAVRVSWDSYAQASANVQLLNDQSVIIAQTTVARRMAAMLWLPRGYRGNVYVQVTAIGYHGERVVGSATLSP